MRDTSSNTIEKDEKLIEVFIWRGDKWRSYELRTDENKKAANAHQKLSGHMHFSKIIG